MKLDLTADEKLVSAPEERGFPNLFRSSRRRISSHLLHPCGSPRRKDRALGERTRPRNLYDVVNLYRRHDLRPAAGTVRAILEWKCEFKNIAVPAFGALDVHWEELDATLRGMLAHQLRDLPPLDGFWEVLPELSAWMAGTRVARV